MKPTKEVIARAVQALAPLMRDAGSENGYDCEEIVLSILGAAMEPESYWCGGGSAPVKKFGLVELDAS